MAEVIPFPSPTFLLELHSERMADALLALVNAGFDVKHIIGTTNRFKIIDAEGYGIEQRKES